MIFMKLPKVPRYEYSSTESPPESEMQMFPTLPRVRKLLRFTRDQQNDDNRNLYKQNTVKEVNELTANIEAEEFASEDIKCRNDHGNINGITPGEFVWSCKHGIVLGIRYLTEVESVRHAYAFLAERIPKHRMKNTFVVFDNACRLLTFIQNRDIDLMAGLKVVTDRFHSKNCHKKCPKSTLVQYWEPYLERHGVHVDKYRTGQHLSTSQAECVNAQLRGMTKSIQCAKMSTHILYMYHWAVTRNLMSKGVISHCTRNGKRK